MNEKNKDKELNTIKNSPKEEKVNREITSKEMEQVVGGAVIHTTHKPRF